MLHASCVYGLHVGQHCTSVQWPSHGSKEPPSPVYAVADPDNTVRYVGFPVSATVYVMHAWPVGVNSSVAKTAQCDAAPGLCYGTWCPYWECLSLQCVCQACMARWRMPRPPALCDTGARTVLRIAVRCVGFPVTATVYAKHAWPLAQLLALPSLPYQTR